MKPKLSCETFLLFAVRSLCCGGCDSGHCGSGCDSGDCDSGGCDGGDIVVVVILR